MSSVHGIILAGGKSSRMGCNKALLKLKGKPIITHLSDLLLAVCRDVTIVLSPDETNEIVPVVSRHVRFVHDIYRNQGPLAGIHAGLHSIIEPYGFVMACDMPLFSFTLFEQMRKHLANQDAVLCQGQPFHAFYHKRAATAAETCLQNRQQKLSRFLEMLDTTYVATEETDCFTNLNTPEDYQDLLAKWNSQ